MGRFCASPCARHAKSDGTVAPDLLRGLPGKTRQLLRKLHTAAAHVPLHMREDVLCLTAGLDAANFPAECGKGRIAGAAPSAVRSVAPSGALLLFGVWKFLPSYVIIKNKVKRDDFGVLFRKPGRKKGW